MAEKEYIERNALIDKIFPIGLIDDGRYVIPAKAVKTAIDKAPTANVVEVRYGEWIIKTDYKTTVSHAHIRKEKLYICPYCGKDYRQHMNFCGNCGAKMDGGTNG